jgi:hypothetical protein
MAMWRKRLLGGLLPLLVLAAGSACATEVNFSGFASFTAGDIISGSNHGTLNNFQCPCFVSNYEYAGVYQDKGWTADPESVVGLQANIKVDDQLAATVQLDARGVNNYQTSVDWAYVTYNLDSHWAIQAGHKRLPLYAYSDSSYIGYSYPWVRPPVDLYGWEIYSYNGVNALYTNTVGDWGLTANVWGGSQSSPDNVELTNIYTGVKTDTAWRDILGAYVDMSNDIFRLRFTYMQNKLDLTEYPNGVPTQLDPPGASQQIYGAAFNADYDNFLWRSEYNTFRRPQMGYNAPSWFTGLGYRLGTVTGMYTFSSYRESQSQQYPTPQRDNTRSVSLRWDFHKNIALKTQYDFFVDHSLFPFTGSSKLLTVSLDTVF